MGLFDAVKTTANALAADAERAGKITAAQARSMVLQSEVRKAERELGHAAFALIEQGEIVHPDLEHAVAVLRETRESLREKEQEIAALRGEADEAGDATDEPAGEAADAAAARPAGTAQAGGEETVEAAASPAAPEVTAEAPADRPPAGASAPVDAA